MIIIKDVYFNEDEQYYEWQDFQKNNLSEGKKHLSGRMN
jgi:hypothetical protein